VPRAELACCRVGDDGDLTAAQPSRAALRLLSGPAGALHGMGTRSPTRRGEVFAPWDRVAWCSSRLSRRRKLLVRTSGLSCEAETYRRGSL
jgi:hypothetical protein